MRELIVLVTGISLASGAIATPGRGGDPEVPIGAAARTRQGPEPLAVPPADVGSAEDPVLAALPAAPAQVPPPPKR